jgi:hypothetical protein
MHPDPSNHSAEWGGHLKDYFKAEKLSNVEADVDLVILAILAKVAPEDKAPAGQHAELLASSAAATAVEAAAASNRADAGFPQELTRFPAHNIILNAAGYFRMQQVRAFCCVEQCVLH